MTIIIATAFKVLQSKKRKHRLWVHGIIKKRNQCGEYNHLVQELQLDGEKFKQYFRLSREQFAQVLFYVEADLVKYCMSREVISPRQRLAICLR